MGKVMPFSLIIFDYDGVLIDSLDDAISVGGEFCRLISHDRVPTKKLMSKFSTVRNRIKMMLSPRFLNRKLSLSVYHP
jgi:phosphoglycolate phosphatase-like HAD superfamily hydrolase